ncbi:MAG TPA: (Fe-S)-binding protein [Candidatus Eremiobacteraceae bacterium]|nr:(Fe-S)-binding protein [Candidatus Eremiobacteraceae bacterium]
MGQTPMGDPGFVAPDVPSDAIVNTCIKCGFCLPVCPTYRLTLDERSSPRGRIGLIAGVLEGKLPLDDPTFTAQMSECLGCRSCEPACPSGVRYGALLEDARAQIAKRPDNALLAPLLQAVYEALFADGRILRFAAYAAGLAQRLGIRRLLRASGALRALGLERLDALLPSPRGAPFVANGQTYHAVGTTSRGSVALFAGCVMGAMFGDIDRSTVRVLAHSGWDVEVPEGQACCGALHLHAGLKDRAREMARATIAAFERSGADHIAVNAAGCGAAMKEYGHLLESDPQWHDRAVNFASRVRDATELVDATGLTDVAVDVHVDRRGRSGEAVSGRAKARPLHDHISARPLQDHTTRVAYQDPCHLAQAQRVVDQPRRAIDAVPGYERVELEGADRCCGSAGVYNLTHPAMADALADRMIAAAKAVGAERLITANPGCQIQLAAASRRANGPSVEHIMEFLDDPATPPRLDEDDDAHVDAKGLAFAIGATVFVGILLFASRRKR